MTMTERATVVGVFNTRAQAESAINDLRTLGFTDKQIGYIVRDTGSAQDTAAPAGSHAESIATGAVGGGVLGGVLGAAASLLIPGFGPAIAGGILAATLGGVAIGAAAGGLIGALTELGVPEEDARYYQGEFEAGRVLVTVQAPGHQQEALEALRRNGAYDASTRNNPGTTRDPAYTTAGPVAGAVNPAGTNYDPTNTTNPAGTTYDPTNTNTTNTTNSAGPIASTINPAGTSYDPTNINAPATRQTTNDDPTLRRPYDPTDVSR